MKMEIMCYLGIETLPLYKIPVSHMYNDYFLGRMSEGTRTSQTQWRDWVGELFTPTLDVEVEELLGNVEDDSPIQSKIKHVAAFDPEAIKQVYERVRVMMALDEEMKKSDKQRKQEESK